MSHMNCCTPSPTSKRPFLCYVIVSDLFAWSRLVRRPVRDSWTKRYPPGFLVGHLPSPVRFNQPCGSSEPSEYVGEWHKKSWHRNLLHDADVQKRDLGVHVAYHPK